MLSELGSLKIKIKKKLFLTDAYHMPANAVSGDARFLISAKSIHIKARVLYEKTCECFC